MSTTHILNRLPRLARRLGLLALVAPLLLTGCDTNDTAEDLIVIENVAISPDGATLEVGQSEDFSVVAVTRSGDRIPIPAELETEWLSTDPAVFTVEDDGVATARSEGEAFCTFSLRAGETEPDENINLIHVITFDSVRVSVISSI